MTTIPVATIFTINLTEARIPSSSFDRSDQPSHATTKLPLLEQNLKALELESDHNTHPNLNKSGATCNACGIASFPTLDEQRQHYKTDWHRFNIKRRLSAIKPITEEEFDKLIENENDVDAVGSLSGSDTSDNDDEMDDDDIDNDDPLSQHASLSYIGPQFIFSLHQAPPLSINKDPSTYYGVWRCLVAHDKLKGADLPTPSECLSNLHKITQSGGKWAIILSRGGHFAAAVLNVTPPSSSASSKQNLTTAQISAAVLSTVCHKSLHTYVVRAKAGGKQSSKDATGKYARSAGSRLRRHNEARLEQDIADTLASWKKQMDECSLILLATPGSNQKVLFGGDRPLLDKQDGRVRKIPFATRRPTASEVQRVARVLLTVYSIQPSVAMSSSSSLQVTSSVVGDVSNETRKEEKKVDVLEPTDNDSVDAEEKKEQEEAARRRKAEKKARQKQKQKEQRQAEALEHAEAAKKAAEDEINKAAMKAISMSRKPPTSKFSAAAAADRPSNTNDNVAKARVYPSSLSVVQQQTTTTTTTTTTAAAASSTLASINSTSNLSILKGRPSSCDDPATRRARLAAAAEARAKALQQATVSQQLR